jgi:alpha-L-fucosidase
LFNLLDIVSKGGNYLLDVGPTALGVIPVVAVNNLTSAGRWLNVNGEAVYGAGLSPFGEGFGGFGRKLFDGKGKAVYLPYLDWRCTAKPGKLYFSIFRWSGNGFKLPAFKNEIKKVYLLSDPNRTDFPVTVTNGVHIVQTPHYAPNVMATVLVVEINGDKVER